MRCNRWINFKMYFIVSERLELVVEKNIELRKELEKILLLLRCKVSTRICDCSNISSLIQTIQYLHSKVIFERNSIFVILFGAIKIVL